MEDPATAAATAMKPVSEMDPEEKEIEQKMIKIISMMPKEVQNRFKVLKVLSDRRSRLNDQFEEEIKVLERKIEEKKKPLYEQRRQVIEGKLKEFGDFNTKFDESLKTLEKDCADLVTKKSAEEKDKPAEENKPVEVDHLKGKDGIPDFWYRAFKNNHMVYELVKEKDEDILKHLKHVESERGDNPKSLTVRFHFEENEFFDNKEISMKVVYKGDEDTVDKIEGTIITWKEGKDPTKKKVKKK